MKPDIASRIVGSAITLLGVCAAISPTPAIAQANTSCLPHAAAIAQQLNKQYGETLTAAGVDANGAMVQVYSNPESGSWTIAISIPNGPTCIISSGEGWAYERAPEAPKPGISS